MMSAASLRIILPLVVAAVLVSAPQLVQASCHLSDEGSQRLAPAGQRLAYTTGGSVAGTLLLGGVGYALGIPLQPDETSAFVTPDLPNPRRPSWMQDSARWKYIFAGLGAYLGAAAGAVIGGDSAPACGTLGGGLGGATVGIVGGGFISLTTHGILSKNNKSVRHPLIVYGAAIATLTIAGAVLGYEISHHSR